ncbi:MAG: ribonuclease P protein component [Bacteriovoracia bacterium]
MQPSKPAKPLAFPRSRRVTKRTDFFRLRKVASKWVSRHWILYYAESESGTARLGVTISAKYGNSVERNSFRRWLREAFRAHHASLKPYDLHFVARQKPTNIAKKRYKDELNEDFQKLLHRFR